MTLKAFPKISHLGTKYVATIFDEPVEITEKIDGSQFVFGKVNGRLEMRSKGAEIFPDAVPKMFKAAADTVASLDLPENVVFYGEYLEKPKHNVLAYERTPRGHIALFGVSDPERETMCPSYDDIAGWADRLGLDVVARIHNGPCTAEQAIALLDRTSALGGQKIEGIVVKNYKACHIAERVYPVMAAKFVSEGFKEVHKKSWGAEFTRGGKWEVFKESYRTEARWLKAVQHLRDAGTLSGEPKDIGALLKEVRRDITEEEKEAIKDFLWREFGDELLRKSTAGLPEWYKEFLARGQLAA